MSIKANKVNRPLKGFEKFLEGTAIASLFLIPIFIVLIIISLHSTMLITKGIALALYIILGVMLVIDIEYIVVFKASRLKVFTKKVANIIAGILLALYIIFVFLLYGPFGGFRQWLITTAMSTMTHQYLCQWFYSTDEIAKIMGDNFVKEVDEKTDESLIGKGGDADSIKVNKKDGYSVGVIAETKDYKIIKLKVNGQNGYLACVYNPSKVKVAYTDRIGVAGRYVTKMAEQRNALLGINAAGFYDPGANSKGSMPGGLTIAGGKVITDNGFHGYSGGGLIGFNNKNVLCLMRNATADKALKAGIRDGVSWGPFLVVNGKSSYVSGNGGWGLAARTAIGQRKDGTVLLLVVDSNSTRSRGAGMRELAEIMMSYGAVNAANLDGGTSSVMVMPSKEALMANKDAKTDGYSTAYRIINDPVDSALQHKTRPIADAFIVER